MRLGRWGPVGAWALAILVGTSIPGSELPPAFPHADKLVHLFLYGVLGALTARALRAGHDEPRASRWAAAVALIGISVFGAADEWHQQFVPGRSGDAADWLADSLGGAVGLSLLVYLHRTEQRT